MAKTLDERINLLLVDDDEVDRMAVRRRLASSALDPGCVEATNVVAARGALARAPVDCVLLDLQLPGTSGLEYLRELRAEGNHTPVIILTGFGDEQTAVELMKAGATDYLAKASVTSERLEQSIRQAIRLHRAEQGERAARARLQRYAEQLEQLTAASLATHGKLSPDSVLDEVARRAHALFGGRAAAVSVLPEILTGQLLHVVAPVSLVRTSGELTRGAEESVRAVAALGTLRLDAQALAAAAAADPEAGGAGADGAHRALLQQLGQWPCRSWTAIGLLARDGRAMGVLSLVDAGEVDEATVALFAQTASIALENARLYQAREEVLAIVSHDLRNPLEVVRLTAAMQLRRATEPGLERFRTAFERVDRAANQMANLVQAVLDAGKIEAGQLHLSPRPEAPRAVAEEAVEHIRPLAAQRQLQLSIACPGNLPAIGADRPRLLQVFSNLLGNAIKFTPPGGEIRVSAQRLPDAVRFDVSDTGPGIPPEELPRLFDRYWQARRTAHLGAGLGLYIARGIVLAHGGRLTVTSALGQGTTFSFTVPLAEAQPTSASLGA